MARVPLLTTDSEVTPDVREDLDADGAAIRVEALGLDRFMNQFAALAHHPPLMKGFHALMRAYYQDSVVESKYIELAILMVSQLNRCHYCVVHHTPPALRSGW